MVGLLAPREGSSNWLLKDYNQHVAIIHINGMLVAWNLFPPG
jgi:hypothetical protein